MANLFSLQIPFCTLSGQSIIQGTAIGSVLSPYEVYEIRCTSGEIFNIEAVPTENGFAWASFRDGMLATAIGSEIEKYFSNLKIKQRKFSYSL